VKANLDHIFGYRLHDMNLEPGKEFTMPGTVSELEGQPAAPGTEAHRMRFEGITRLDGNRVALFAILPSARETPRAAVPSSTYGEAGRAAYRIEDGLLERLVAGNCAIRRTSTQVSDLGN
jgi:hypothetical protein